MRPNPWMNEAQFNKAVVVSHDVAGVFYAEIVRGRNRLPAALYPLDPAKMTPIPGNDGGVAQYEFRDGSKKITLPAEDVLVWRNMDLRTRYNGLSPLSVAMGSIAGDTAQTNYINSFFETGGVPSGILKIKGRTVEQDESDAIRAKWRAKFQPSSGGNSTDIAVLDENADYQQLGSKLNELQSEEIRSVAESRICMVLGVPPLIIYSYMGLKGATYSNLKEAWSSFWDSRLLPWFDAFRSWLTWSLLTEFEDEALIFGERVRLSHDYSKVSALQEDVDAAHERARQNFIAGGITLNEYRSIIGLPPDPNGDVYYVSNSGTFRPSEDLTLALPSPAPAGGADPTPTNDTQRGKARPLSPQAKALSDDQRAKIEARIKKKMAAYLAAQYEAAAKAVEAAAKADGVNADEITGAMDDGTEAAAAMERIYPLAIKRAFQDAGLALEMAIDFSLENVAVRRVLDKLLTKIKSVSDTTKEAIRELVAQQAREGWAIPRLADEIRAAGALVTPKRAETIARTETATAYTQGSLLAYRESKVVEYVEWSAVQEDPADSCFHLNGKRVKLGEQFDGGYDGPPVHPNCRCALLPIVFGAR